MDRARRTDLASAYSGFASREIWNHESAAGLFGRCETPVRHDLLMFQVASVLMKPHSYLVGFNLDSSYCDANAKIPSCCPMLCPVLEGSLYVLLIFLTVSCRSVDLPTYKTSFREIHN
ncbi:hypothetical protein CDL15_Pgr006425 [Punica granatum]|uniref:Uncharacterized protein n=1 Tax=Punica granatum TaxID=22663 RepID=A0A218XYQ8_PUNGR|nr:hypothetical protein CDL15_Pgr006425 [Punica granatum]